MEAEQKKLRILHTHKVHDTCQPRAQQLSQLGALHPSKFQHSTNAPHSSRRPSLSLPHPQPAPSRPASTQFTLCRWKSNSGYFHHYFGIILEAIADSISLPALSQPRHEHSLHDGSVCVCKSAFRCLMPSPVCPALTRQLEERPERGGGGEGGRSMCRHTATAHTVRCPLGFIYWNDGGGGRHVSKGDDASLVLCEIPHTPRVTSLGK